MFGGNKELVFGGNKVAPTLPVFANESSYQCQNNASNQLQLFGNIPAACSVNPGNYFGDDSIMLQSHKRSRETEDISGQQKLKISLNYSICQDDIDRSANLPAPNPVSTGLRLSYDDDEHNSSVTSASGSMTATPSVFLSLGDSIKTELDRQNEEIDRYIKAQEGYIAKGVKDMKERHMASFLAAVQKGVHKKLREKDVEIESMNRKNRELAERIKQVTMEAQNWQCRAKYNESVVNVLKTNLQQAVSAGAGQVKEGFGDSEVDDAASYVNLSNYVNLPVGPSLKFGYGNDQGVKEQMICRACKSKEVSVLLMPCRHLCLCSECGGLLSICPVCQLMVTGFVPVYLS